MDMDRFGKVLERLARPPYRGPQGEWYWPRAAIPAYRAELQQLRIISDADTTIPVWRNPVRNVVEVDEQRLERLRGIVAANRSRYRTLGDLQAALELGEDVLTRRDADRRARIYG